jgi:hypothetical protein
MVRRGGDGEEVSELLVILPTSNWGWVWMVYVFEYTGSLSGPDQE